MLILILVGVLCSKTGIISKEANKGLSSFLMQIINPVVIFMSYQTDYRPELVRNLLLTFLLSGVAFAVYITSCYIFVRRKDGRDTEIERFSSVYSNCGFMGIPLVSALFGDEGVFYLAAFITMFNLIAWTQGMIMLTGEKDLKKAAKVFYSPTVISIVLGLRVEFYSLKDLEYRQMILQSLKWNLRLMARLESIRIGRTGLVLGIRLRDVLITSSINLLPIRICFSAMQRCKTFTQL